MLALFSAAPPKQPKPSPASPSADMHVLTLPASCERFPLSPPLQVRVREARRPATEAAAAETAVAATTTTTEVRTGVCGGVLRMHARGWMTAAATGGGGVRRDVATARRRRNCPSTRSPVGACWRRAP